jgi:hypothetical protein
VSQDILVRVREQVQALRDDDGFPAADLLAGAVVERALAEEPIDFRARVFTPLVTLQTFLTQVLSADHSCREAVAKLIAFLVAHGRPACSEDTNSYCQARKRLPTGLIARLVRRTARDLEEAAERAWLWKGRSVYLIDGTTVSMPDTPANQAAYPQSRSQQPGLGFPLARVVAIVSLATGAVHDLALGPYKGKQTGETGLFRTLLDRLKGGDVVVGDRVFASFFGIAQLVERGVDGLFRTHQRRKVDFRRGRRLGVEDRRVDWPRPDRPEWMDEATYERIPPTMTVRVLRVRVAVPGYRVQQLVLVTTLLDPVEFPKEDLAELFLGRWGIELDLRSIKVVMQMDVLRCKSPALVEKEVWAHLLAYNVVRGLMARAAAAHGSRPRELSFKGALQALTAFRDVLRMADGELRRRLWEVMLKVIAGHRVGDRPERIEPRAKKRRPKPYRMLTVPRDEARKRLLRIA